MTSSLPHLSLHQHPEQSALPPKLSLTPALPAHTHHPGAKVHLNTWSPPLPYPWHLARGLLLQPGSQGCQVGRDIPGHRSSYLALLTLCLWDRGRGQGQADLAPPAPPDPGRTRLSRRQYYQQTCLLQLRLLSLKRVTWPQATTEEAALSACSRRDTLKPLLAGSGLDGGH